MENRVLTDSSLELVLSNAVISLVLQSHRKELIGILKEIEDNQHYSIYFHFLLLLESQPKICEALLRDAESCLPTLDKALILAQQTLYDSIVANRIDRVRRDRSRRQRTHKRFRYREESIARNAREACSINEIGEEEEEEEGHETGVDGDEDEGADESEFGDSIALLSVKKKIHFRIIGFPFTANEPYILKGHSADRFPRKGNNENEGNLPKPRHVGLFLSIRGTVVKVGQTKMIEESKIFRCVRCGFSLEVKADYEQGYAIVPPHLESCRCDPVKGPLNRTNRFKPVDNQPCPLNRKDFQEIKLQEPLDERLAGTMTTFSIEVTLEDDLVDRCQPGDDVTVTGQVLQRWAPLIQGNRVRIDLVFKANSIQVQNNCSADKQPYLLRNYDTGMQFRNYWVANEMRPLRARNRLISSFCPQVHGMYTVKLAMLIILAGGTSLRLESGVEIRGLSHMLLVGDPGIAKSQLLKYVARLCPRSVFTTGIGSTNAGLTASAIKENGQWHLEAGALVLADGGICCIDEFSTMDESDRSAIHEAMEQQTVSVSKAGIVCRLKTRCSILAACNAKGGAYYDTKRSVSENCGIDRPLLTRFDLIFVLVDKNDRVWDEKVASHILKTIPDGEETRKEREEVELCSCGGACSGLCSERVGVSGSCRESNSSVVSSFSDSNTDYPSSDWVWSFEKIRNYLTFIKTITPEFQPGAKRILSEYYLLKREDEQRNPSETTTTTVRTLESLMRLAEGHARLMLRDRVNISDALLAVHLMETSLMSSLFYPIKDGIHSTVPEDPTVEERINGQLIVDKMGLDYEKLERMDEGYDERDFADHFFDYSQNNTE